MLNYAYVSGNSLTGTMPSELGELSQLQQLYAHTNDLTGTMPSEVCAMRTTKGGALQHLELDCGVNEVECSCCTRC